MRLLATLVFLAFALLMLAGYISEGMRRPTAPHIDFKPMPKAPALERLPVRRIDCERVEDLVGMTAVCA